MQLESAGVPTVVVATTKFRMLTEQVAASLDSPDTRVLVVPHPLGGTDDATIVAWADAAVDQAIELFTGKAPPADSAAAPVAPVGEISGGDSRGDIADAVAVVREIVAADGGDIVLDEFDGSTATLRLVLDSAECRECVMPREFLEQVALDKMTALVPGLSAVTITDPREV